MLLPLLRKRLFRPSLLFPLVTLAFLSGCSGIFGEARLKHYPITDFGAVADGTTLNTTAIQHAIDTAQAAGGGVVDIPAGKFLSGAIFLKPGVELCLAEGAVLLGSQNIQDYPLQRTRIEGHFQDWRVALVNVGPMDHVRISGRGQLNGNGSTYWAAFGAARRANSKTANLDVERPRLLFVDRCNDVRIEGVSLRDSGFWNIHLYRCRNVLIQGVDIFAPAGTDTSVPREQRIRAYSSDGIDIDSCQDVTVRQCRISNGDDDIALKGSKGVFADKDADSPPVENILVEDCVIGEGNGLITCGSEATLVRNVTVRNCTITGNATLLTLKLRTDTPQHYENITFDNITLNGGGRVFNINGWKQYEDFQGQPPPTHLVNNVTVRHVTGKFKTLGQIRGNAGDTLRDIVLEDANLTLTDELFGYGERDEGSFAFKNVIVNGQPYVIPGPTAPPRPPPPAADGAPGDAAATSTAAGKD
jgi:polygalacturonase